MNKYTFIALIFIIIIASFLRLWDLKNVPPGLWSDEAMNGTNALVALENKDWKIFYPENFGREGLFINIQSSFVAYFGNEPWVLRLPSAIFGILTVLGLYLMTKELFGERVALLASFFLATLFWHINFSRIGFRAIMAPFFLVWSFYFLFLGIRKAKEIFFIIAGFFLGLGFHSYIAFRVAPLIALLPLWKFYRDYKGGLIKNCAPCLIGLFIFASLVATFPLLFYYAQNPTDFLGRTTGISIFSSSKPLAPTPIKLVWGLAQFSENTVKTIQMFFIFGDFNWRHNFAGSPQLWWPVAILFLIGLILSLKKTMSFTHKFLLLWFGVMLLPIALSNEGLPHALRSIVLIPPAVIFVALGLEWIINKTKIWLETQKQKYPKKSYQLARIQKELAILLFIFLGATAVHNFNQYFLRWAPNPNTHEAFEGDNAAIGQFFKKEPKNIKKYVVTGAVDRVDTTGTPISIQPIVFLTDTVSIKKQIEKNIYYLTFKEIDKIDCKNPCIIVSPDEHPVRLLRQIKEKIPGLRLDLSPGFVVLKK